MTYRSIAVHVTPTEAGLRRLALADELAAAFGARLVGLGAVDTEEKAAVTAGLTDEDLRRRRSEFQDTLDALGSQFHKGATRLSASWHSGLTPPVDFCANAASAADLVVAGLKPESEPSPGFRLDPSALLMRIGKPLLLVPEQPGALDTAQIVVAWKSTREARLAVQLALPIAIHSGHVTVVGVGDEVELSELRAVSDWLRLHNVSAYPEHVPAGSQSAAATLTAYARDNGAHLIVSGGFRRRPLTEWVLGGVTRELLAQHTISCLLAH